MYRSFRKINEYYLSGRRGLDAWRAELLRRVQGRSFTVHDQYFVHHNPLYGLREPWAWIVDRYKPAFDFLDGKRFRRVIEVGCAHGLSTWLLTDIADEVWGIDTSEGAIEIANTLFPEVRFIGKGMEEAFGEIDARFDLVLDCYGPWGDTLAELARRHAEMWVHIGYRTRRFSDMFRWQNKLPGRHLSFECTAVGRDQRGISWRYPKYFLTKRYLQHLRHSLLTGYWPQI